MKYFRVEINEDKNGNINVETFKQWEGGSGIHGKITVNNKDQLKRVKEKINQFLD